MSTVFLRLDSNCDGYRGYVDLVVPFSLVDKLDSSEISTPRSAFLNTDSS
jgi:hypothetical protein